MSWPSKLYPDLLSSCRAPHRPSSEVGTSSVGSPPSSGSSSGGSGSRSGSSGKSHGHGSSSSGGGGGGNSSSLLSGGAFGSFGAFSAASEYEYGEEEEDPELAFAIRLSLQMEEAAAVGGGETSAAVESSESSASILAASSSSAFAAATSSESAEASSPSSSSSSSSESAEASSPSSSSSSSSSESASASSESSSSASASSSSSLSSPSSSSSSSSSTSASSVSASSYFFEGHASFATSGVIAAIVAAGSDSAALFAAGKSIVDFIHATTFAEAVIKAGKSSGVSARLALLGSLGEKLMSVAAAHHYCPLVVIRVCEAFEVLSSTDAATQNACIPYMADFASIVQLYQDDAAVLQAALSALDTILFDSAQSFAKWESMEADDRRTAVYEAGLLRTIVVGIQRHVGTKKVLEVGCRLIASVAGGKPNYSTCPSESIRDELVGHGILPLLLSILEDEGSEDADVRDAALTATLEVIRFAEEYRDAYRRKSDLLKLGAAQTILETMQNHTTDHRTLTLGCMILNDLVRSGGKNKATVTRAWDASKLLNVCKALEGPVSRIAVELQARSRAGNKNSTYYG